MGNTVNTLSSDMTSVKTSVNGHNSAFSNNYKTITVHDLQFDVGGWGITPDASGELNFYGINTAVSPPQSRCAYMFIKNNRLNQNKDFFLVGVNAPGQLVGTTSRTCENLEAFGA